MAEIVNLRRARRARAREDAARQAAENRVRHGRTKAELQATAKQREIDARRIDGAALTRPDPLDS